MTRILAKGAKLWPKQAESLPTQEVVKLYETGFAGVWFDPEAKEELRDEIRGHGGFVHGADAASAGGFMESGAGKLVAPWLFHSRTFPNCWPGAAQARGDCVSHGSKNAALLTLVCEIVIAKPDEVSGILEGLPELTSAGITEGTLSSEYQYWFRGYNGDGWSCGAAAKVILKNGILLRIAYPEIGIDLTKYSGGLAGKYGRSSPPENISSVGKQHLVRTCTEPSGFEQVRDFLHNGYGISSCGSEGFSSKRDENGVASRKGSWSHAMAYIGADDRAETHSKYGGPLVLVQNSWGASWIGGSRKVLNSDAEIPEGSFWAKWKDISRRDMYAYSSVVGWPSKTLPDYGAGEYL